MDIDQLLSQTVCWSNETILEELEQLPDADETDMLRLQQQAYLLLPDTEHSEELYYLVRQLRQFGHLQLVASCYEKSPVSGVGQAACEGYRLYATSLFIALSLLKFTTRCCGQLRCALLVLKDSPVNSLEDARETPTTPTQEGSEPPPPIGMSTPDGKIQRVSTIVAGVYWVDTGSHGFLVISLRLAQRLLTQEARAIGEKRGKWLLFEEDCAVAAPLYEHPEWQLWAGFTKDVYDAEAALHRYFPQYFDGPRQMELPLSNE